MHSYQLLKWVYYFVVKMDSNHITKVSVCIPTYEMKGKGVEYLNHSLQILSKQTFTDFEVVISDQSENDEIEELCKQWSSSLNIKHTYYREGARRSSSNINNAIKNANSDIIKILFQDDFLYDSQSLETELVHFLGNHNHWLITACCHTKDGVNLINPFYPKYNDEIHYGNNTVSSPSVLMMSKESFLEFDENLFWLMDVEYYKRMFDSWGLPSICNYTTVVNREHENQVSNIYVNDEVRRKELQYVTEKYSGQKSLDLPNVTLIAVTSVRVDEHVKALEYSAKDINFGAIKIVSDTPPWYLPEGIQHEYIDPMSNIDEWSHSIIYKLGNYIDTEYVMLIHDDGFIINPSSWKDEFLEYDYIGAPWPIPGDSFSYRDINGELIRVGNSVSLRSKKLVDLPVKLDLEWKPFHGYYNEDGFITVNYRHIYKEHGCKFADINIAKYFSHETPLPETQGITPFAFHGKNKYKLEDVVRKELVIAAYDKDLEWLQDVNPDVKKTVYRKGTAPINSSEILVEPNVGRCVHSFFNHIHSRYDSLADYTFFAQDYPFDHWGNLLEVLNGPVENCRNKASLAIGGYYGYHNNTLGTAWQLQPTAQFGQGGTLWCLSNGHPQDTNPDIDVDRYWEILFDEPKPNIYEFMPGGHFAITKQQIHTRPKEFYKKIVDLLEQEQIAPWLVERLECYIFNNKYKIKQIK